MPFLVFRDSFGFLLIDLRVSWLAKSWSFLQSQLEVGPKASPWANLDKTSYLKPVSTKPIQTKSKKWRLKSRPDKDKNLDQDQDKGQDLDLDHDWDQYKDREQ